MKNKKMLILSMIVNVVFLLIICIFISGDKNIIKGKQVIKEMTQSENETNIQTQINTLNASHTDYANSIEESKKKLASAITEMGVETSSDITLDAMAENIKNISTDVPRIIIDSYGNQGVPNISIVIPKGFTKAKIQRNGQITRNGTTIDMTPNVEYDIMEGDRIFTWSSSASSAAPLELW